MKNSLIIVAVLFSTLAANAEAYFYYNNPTYCRAEWNCEVFSTDFRTAQKYCSRQPFANGVATVYEFARGEKNVLKGYGCYESNGGN